MISDLLYSIQTLSIPPHLSEEFQDLLQIRLERSFAADVIGKDMLHHLERCASSVVRCIAVDFRACD